MLSMPYCPSIDMILHFHSTVLCYSIMFRDALEESGVKNQIHIYRSDFHGLSLGTLEVMNPKKPFKANVSDWPERADKFLQSVFGSVF